MRFARTGTLDIAYLDFGPDDGPPVILLHGFPYDPQAFVATARALALRGKRCLLPYLRGYGPTRFLTAETPRSGQQGALGRDLLEFMDALGITRATLGGFDWGGRAACVVAALWPDRVGGLVSGAEGYNIQNIPQAGIPAPPEEERRFWYMYYLNTPRGEAGLRQDRRAFCRYLWSLWSPTWRVDEATFATTAASFDNPDFVDIVVHSYRHRLGGLPGDPTLDEIEAQLAAQPDIAVPTIVLQGLDDGVDVPPSEDIHRPHFTGFYEHRPVPGVGHNLPQEAPEAFARAILDLP